MRRKTTLLWIAAGLVVTAGTLFVVAHAVVGAAPGAIHHDVAAASERDVILVPGAGLMPDGTPHSFLQQRLKCARDAYAAGKAPYILVSGDHGEVGYDEPTAMKTWLVNAGVPEAAITRDHAGFRTRDTMVRAVEVFGARSALICTQGLHAERSLFLAHDAGLVADVLVAGGDRWFRFHHKLREHLATVAAALDALVGTEPRFLGPPVQLGQAP